MFLIGTFFKSTRPFKKEPQPECLHRHFYDVTILVDLPMNRTDLDGLLSITFCFSCCDLLFVDSS